MLTKTARQVKREKYLPHDVILPQDAHLVHWTILERAGNLQVCSALDSIDTLPRMHTIHPRWSGSADTGLTQRSCGLWFPGGLLGCGSIIHWFQDGPLSEISGFSWEKKTVTTILKRKVQKICIRKFGLPKMSLTHGLLPTDLTIFKFPSAITAIKLLSIMLSIACSALQCRLNLPVSGTLPPGFPLKSNDFHLQRSHPSLSASPPYWFRTALHEFLSLDKQSTRYSFQGILQVLLLQHSLQEEAALPQTAHSGLLLVGCMGGGRLQPHPHPPAGWPPHAETWHVFQTATESLRVSRSHMEATPGLQSPPLKSRASAFSAAFPDVCSFLNFPRLPEHLFSKCL